MNTFVSDAEVLIRSRTDPEALGVLYDRHAAAVHSFLARRAGSGVADDLLSEVFVAAVRARRRVRPHVSGSALPWLYGIARNVVGSHLRSVKQSPSLSVDAGVDWAAAVLEITPTAARSRLHRARARAAATLMSARQEN